MFGIDRSRATPGVFFALGTCVFMLLFGCSTKRTDVTFIADPAAANRQATNGASASPAPTPGQSVIAASAPEETIPAKPSAAIAIHAFILTSSH